MVSWLWHWLCCSVDPLQRCYRPAGTCNKCSCPPDPWWVLKFYSPLSWPHWLCSASPSHPSTATKKTQQIHRLHFNSLHLICYLILPSVIVQLWACILEGFTMHIYFSLLHYKKVIALLSNDRYRYTDIMPLAVGTVHYICTTHIVWACVGLTS